MTANDKLSQADLLESTFRVPEQVVYRSFAHETVVLNLKTGQYHGLNPTAAAMLAELERGGTVREAAKRLALRFERRIDEVEGDLSNLCLDLLERELIEPSNVSGRASERVDPYAG
jgi:coenzyme PQQ synthesis protein D (PqqD)